MKEYLQETALLNFHHPEIQRLIISRQWQDLDAQKQILAIYNFVRDDIQFGFNAEDTTAASEVLSDGYGQCNTKSILFMALLRAVDIPCRLHGFTINKALQSGIMNGDLYQMMPEEISHTWTEVYLANRWYCMEGLILDIPYLSKLQQKFSDIKGQFSGYAVATTDLQNPSVYWLGNNDTYIQKEGIVQDFGIFESPDIFFSQYPQKMDRKNKKLFSELYRHEINKHISDIRSPQQPDKDRL